MGSVCAEWVSDPHFTPGPRAANGGCVKHSAGKFFLIFWWDLRGRAGL
jgi:hypothetical protein